MKIGIHGSRNFSDYAIFLNAMNAVLFDLKESQDSELLFYTAGPSKVNSMVTEYSNVSERGLKSRGIKNRFFKIPMGWLRDNLTDMDLLLYFSLPKESPSDIVDKAKKKSVEYRIYRY